MADGPTPTKGPSRDGVRSGRRSSGRDGPTSPEPSGGPETPERTESKAERRARRRRRRRMIYAGIAAAVAIGVVVGGWALWHFVLHPPAAGTVSSGGPGGNNTSGLPPPPVLILPDNTQFNLDPGKHQDYAFTLNRTCVLSGHFSSTAPVNVLVLTSTQYQAWTGGGSLNSQWSSGPEKTGEVQTSQPAGAYEVVFLNPSSSTPEFVQVPGGVTATPV